MLKKDINEIINEQIHLSSKYGLKMKDEYIGKERIIIFDLFIKYENEY